jgi:hypothetical protein
MKINKYHIKLNKNTKLELKKKGDENKMNIILNLINKNRKEIARQMRTNPRSKG